jgi:predicted nucleic acid-binding protein
VGVTGQLYLADKSALARIRHDVVARAMEPLISARVVATCAIVDLEMLHSARSPLEYTQHARVRREGFVHLPMNEAICARALEVQGILSRDSQHRGAGMGDLLIAACAEAHGATIVHYDSDYDLIARVTGQPALWVVPPGRVP